MHALTKPKFFMPIHGEYRHLMQHKELAEFMGMSAENIFVMNVGEVLELDSFITSPVRTLSLGQRMRADIAAALLHNPKVLFLDEPTIGLDVVVKDNIRKAIQKINEESGTTVILTTHDLEDIELLCKRIVMIDKGKKVFDGELSELRQRYGQMRELAFELKEKEHLDKLSYEKDFSFAQGDFILEANGGAVKVRFNSDTVSVEDMLSYTLSRVHVKDINVKDADIEEIIRRLYKGGGDMDETKVSNL